VNGRLRKLSNVDGWLSVLIAGGWSNGGIVPMTSEFELDEQAGLAPHLARGVGNSASDIAAAAAAG
jgi:hypothetical protein